MFLGRIDPSVAFNVLNPLTVEGCIKKKGDYRSVRDEFNNLLCFKNKFFT